MSAMFSYRFKQSLRFPLFLLVVIWLIHGLQMISGGSLSALGVLPGHKEGLKGILMAPLIHGSLSHLLSNTIPLFVLTLIISFFYRKVAYLAFGLIYLLSGAAVWMFAREVYHIGASGLVYGLLSFVFWSGVFRRNIKSIVLALIVTLLYSGYIWGVLPVKEGISWESHLFGGIVGIVIAYLLRGYLEMDEEPTVYPYEKEPTQDPDYFYDRDVFKRH